MKRLKRHPTLFVIAGCNGAGKTTLALEFLSKEVKCSRFLNADEIARGLSPLDPNLTAVKAGRLLLREVRDAIASGETFALESTLSGRTYVGLFRKARRAGYRVKIFYLWLSSAELAIQRVKERMLKGGAAVPLHVIRRRYVRSVENFVRSYEPLARSAVVFDNSGRSPRLVSERRGNTLLVLDRGRFDVIFKGRQR